MTGRSSRRPPYGANIVIIVVNNGMYGTIRMHQERDYPGRVRQRLVNPDFAALARSYGAQGETVEETAGFEARRSGASLDAGQPALIHVKIDPEALTPKQSLSDIRRGAAASRKK